MILINIILKGETAFKIALKQLLLYTFLIINNHFLVKGIIELELLATFFACKC